MGSIYIGKCTIVEPGTFIKGPCIIGNNCTIRMGAYIRGDCVIGDDVTLRCECKNSVIMDGAQLCHPSYVGDSLCGFQSHFGNQATAANKPLMSSSSTLSLTLGGDTYLTNRSKIGVILGDFCQLGCNSVTDPATFLAPNTHVYPLSRVTKGFYGPDVIIKNKPMESGVVTVVKLKAADGGVL
jgi:NDP-sugar pyrophosphorylase family protein